MTWSKYWEYKPASTATRADQMLGAAVLMNLSGANDYFLKQTMGEGYATPRDYMTLMVNYAYELTQNRYAVPYAPPGWDFVKAGMDAAFSCFEMLKKLPVNAGDEHTLSMYDAWTHGTGALYGGHDPIPANTGDGVNAETGQSAAPAGTIL